MSDVNKVLQILSKSLGSYDISNDGDSIQFFCPKCRHHKKKLSITISKNLFHCWVCDYSGYGIHKLVNTKSDKVELKKLTNWNSTKHTPDIFNKEITSIDKPNEFEPLTNNSNSILKNNTYNYALKRGLTEYYIDKYNLMYVSNPNSYYANRLIIPSYNAMGQLNYFNARSIYDSEKMKYKNPNIEKSLIVPFELYISWNQPVVLVEGMIDAIKVDYNAIPLMGNTVSDLIIEKILYFQTPEVYLLLDGDAHKFLYRNCKKLIENSITPNITLLEDKKDPGELSTSFLQTILANKSFRCNFEYMMKLKLLSKEM